MAQGQIGDTDLQNSGVTAGTYNSVTVNVEGFVTAGSNTVVVTSVGLTAPAALLTVGGTPVTSSGTLSLTLASQAVGLAFMGPSSGGSAAPTFRSLVAADLAASPGTGNVLTYNGTTLTWAAPSSGAASPLTLTSTAPAQIPLTVKGASSQTGNLTEWNSVSGSGGDLAKMDKAGVLTAKSVVTNCTTVSSSYTVLATDSLILVAGSGTIVITLPAPASSVAGKVYTIKRVSPVVTSLTVSVSGGSNIDGSTSYSLSAQWATLTVFTDGVNQWYIVSKI